MVKQTAQKMGQSLDTLIGAFREPGNLRSTLQSIVQVACQFFHVDYCTLFAFNPITGRAIVPVVASGNFSSENRMAYHRQLERLLPHVMQEDIVMITNVRSIEEDQGVLLNTDIQSLAALTLRTNQQQKLLGLLVLHFKKEQRFSLNDREVFRMFAHQASFLLQETWLLLRYKVVAEIGQEINQELATVDMLFQKLRNRVPSVLDTRHALLLTIYQPQTNTFDIYLEDEGRIIREEGAKLNGACFYVIKTLRPQFIRQLSKEAEHLPFQLNHIPGTGTNETFIFVPLVLRNIALGVLSIQHPRPNAYTEEDLSILQLLANHIALALSNMRLYSSMQQLNETGQFLTQQLDSKLALEEIAEKIRDTTKSDNVVLYPYEPTQQAMLPPRTAGLLKQSVSEPVLTDWPETVKRMLRRVKPLFAKESSAIYSALYGDKVSQYGSFQRRENIHSTAVVPLHIGDQAFGVLFVNFCLPQRFDAPQKLFIEGLAHYAAITIKNAGALEKILLRRIADLETLQDIDRSLNRNLALNHVLNTLLELARERIHADDASILLYEPYEKVFEAKATAGMHTELSRSLRFHLSDESIICWVFKQKRSALVHNVHKDPLWHDLYLENIADTTSELAIPLLDDDEVVGVLNFESAREGAFSQDDEAFLRTLAGQAVLAIKKAQAYEREKRFAEEARVLNQISKEITSQLNVDRVFDLILKKALELTHSHTGVLMLYDPVQNDLEMKAERGVLEEKKGQRHGLNQGIVGHVARSKQFLNVDPSQPPWNDVYLHYIPGTRSELAVPMLEGDTIRGVLNIESDTPDNFSEGDVRLLQGLADLAVVALQNAERYEGAERERRRFELLYQAGRELGKISALAQLEQVYDVILHIAEQYSSSQVVIHGYDEDTEESLLLCASERVIIPFYQKLQLDEGIDDQVRREQRTILINNVYNPPSGISVVKLTDPTIHALIIVPILFKDRYYGSLGLSHQKIGRFKEPDKDFFESLAQQLASTIYRLEAAQAQQESEQRARAAEDVSWIGQSALGLTHRLGILGLIPSYVDDIQKEMEHQAIKNTLISKKLALIEDVVGRVLQLSVRLKRELAKSGEEMIGERVTVAPRLLIEEVYMQFSSWLPPTIKITMAVDEDTAEVHVFRELVVDILHHLVQNAIEAMPDGGNIVLKAGNSSRFVILEVRDTGQGIPEYKLSQIFGLFFSTKNSSGFGLWSARRNAVKNYGELTVESQLGRGTTFRLSLPKVGKRIV